MVREKKCTKGGGLIGTMNDLGQPSEVVVGEADQRVPSKHTGGEAPQI